MQWRENSQCFGSHYGLQFVKIENDAMVIWVKLHQVIMQMLHPALGRHSSPEANKYRELW